MDSAAQDRPNCNAAGQWSGVTDPKCAIGFELAMTDGAQNPMFTSS